MKKTLLTLFCALVALCGYAQTTKTYTEKLIVSVNEMTSDPMEVPIQVTDNGDGTIDFNLKNFVLDAGDGDTMPVGNISISSIPVEEKDGIYNFVFNGNVKIEEGDLEGVDFWMGPLLPEIPMQLKGKVNENKLYVTIDIDLSDPELLGQMIYVKLGSDFEPEPTKVVGDVNGDGVVTIKDVVAVLEIMAAQ